MDAFFMAEFPDAMKLIGKEILIKDFLSSRPSHLISIKVSHKVCGRLVHKRKWNS